MNNIQLGKWHNMTSPIPEYLLTSADHLSVFIATEKLEVVWYSQEATLDCVEHFIS